MVVKENQPELYHAVEKWFCSDGVVWGQVSIFTKRYGRHEWRTLERRAVIDLPWTGQRREFVNFGLIGLSWQQASAADLEHLWRGH